VTPKPMFACCNLLPVPGRLRQPLVATGNPIRMTPASITNRDLDQGIVGGASPLGRPFVCVSAFSDTAKSRVLWLFPRCCANTCSAPRFLGMINSNGARAKMSNREEKRYGDGDGGRRAEDGNLMACSRVKWEQKSERGIDTLRRSFGDLYLPKGARDFPIRY